MEAPREARNLLGSPKDGCVGGECQLSGPQLREECPTCARGPRRFASHPSLGLLLSDAGGVWEVGQRFGQNIHFRNLNKQLDRDLYEVVYTHPQGKTAQHFVHRLVLETFVGPCPPDQECRHLDGFRDHNCLANLAWGTQAENEADKALHEALQQGTRFEILAKKEAQSAKVEDSPVASGEDGPNHGRYGPRVARRGQETYLAGRKDGGAPEEDSAHGPWEVKRSPNWR